MVSFAVRHAAESPLTGRRILPSMRKGDTSGRVVATRMHFKIATSYQIDEANGSPLITVPAMFPDTKYGALDYIPERTGYRFLGWFTSASGGKEVFSQDKVEYGVTPIYAHWQDHVTVTFDATTNGGEMPSGWVPPYYFAGQPFGILPIPTHPTLNFGGWFNAGGERVTEASAVPQNGAALTAQYVNSYFSVDLNYDNGDVSAWRDQSPNTNPDLDTYAGVYESNRYWNAPPGECMTKLKIDVVGYTSFRVYIRSNAENGWSYVVAMPADVDPQSVPSSSDGVANTASSATSDTSISGYTPVDYQLDGGQHQIFIVYRHSDGYVVGDDRGYVLIPRVQGGG